MEVADEGVISKGKARNTLREQLQIYGNNDLLKLSVCFFNKELSLVVDKLILVST